MDWGKAQQWEKTWWGNCANTLGEEQKQMNYAQLMGLKVYANSQSSFNIDMGGKSVLDIGGGPCSMLLKCKNVRGTVVDPLDYPEWIALRYREAGIDYQKGKGEDINARGFDEVWIYNVLQHVESPQKVIENAKVAGKLIRVFEWLEIGSSIGHPHNLLEHDLNNWFEGRGKVTMGEGGKQYSGIVFGSTKVAVCIASYNYGEFLPELLDSLAEQTFKDFRVYICYDGSTDNTLEVIRRYQDELHIITVDYQPTPGIGLMKHRVVERALADKPTYVQMIDADDKVLPTFLQAVVTRMDKGDVDWVICWGSLFGDRRGYIHSAIAPLDELLKQNERHSWGTFKAEVLQKFNYDRTKTYAEDWDLWIRLDMAGHVGATVNEELYLKRWHDECLTVTHSHAQPKEAQKTIELHAEESPGAAVQVTGRQPGKFRFHYPGLVHLPISERYMACAFTQKIVKLSKMLLELGHEVYLYGAESSDAPCTEFIQTHTMQDIRDSWGEGDSRFDIGYDWRNKGFKHDFNGDKTPATMKFYAMCAVEINKRKRPDDFLLLAQGSYHKPIAEAVKLFLTCEPGVGYRGSYAEYRAFESAYMMNFTYGSEHPRQSINGHYYDRVIPNYFDPKDFEFSEPKRDYFLFIGRIIDRKGVWTAVKATEAIGAKLVIAGQQDEEIDVSRLPGHCEFVGYVGPKKRTELMKYAKAVFVPTLFLEPFAGVHVEAMLCGTPVITTNFGVFPETVLNGVNGFRCDTLQDFVNAAKMVNCLSPRVVREHGQRFLMDNVKTEYEKWFRELYRLYLSAVRPDVKGWHHLE